MSLHKEMTFKVGIVLGYNRKLTVEGSGMSTRKYKNAPIEEAVFEIRFGNLPWDVTWPGQLFAQIKHEFPEKPRLQQQSVVTIEQGIGLTVKSESQKTQFLSADERRLLSLGPGSFSIHELKPYGGWGSFIELVRSNLKSFTEVVGEAEINRIGIRYINKILLPGESVELADYFTCLPVKPNELPETISNFFLRMDFATPGKDSVVRVTLANGESIENGVAVLLDIDAIWENSQNPYKLGGGAQLTEFFKLTSALREQERNVFEAIITEKARETFDAQIPAT